MSVGHGAPVRLRVERQLGYKHAKYVERIEAVADLSTIRGGKGGYWDPYYYKKRNKRRDKHKDIVEFIEDVATPQLAQAPLEVQQQAREALEASRLAVDKANAEYQRRALVEIAEFYALVRHAVKRRREEEDEDDLLLLS